MVMVQVTTMMMLTIMIIATMMMMVMAMAMMIAMVQMNKSRRLTGLGCAVYSIPSRAILAVAAP